MRTADLVRRQPAAIVEAAGITLQNPPGDVSPFREGSVGQLAGRLRDREGDEVKITVSVQAVQQ